MNREEIENLVIEATGRSDKLTLIRSAIDIAIQELSAERLWIDLLTTADATVSAGAESVDLASDVARVTSVRLINDTLSYSIEIRPQTWIAQRFPNPSADPTNKPVYGYLQGTALYLIPLPDDDYTVRYSYYPVHSDLNASTDEITIRGADKAVMAYAIAFVFRSIEKFIEAEQWQSQYDKFLMSAKKLDKGNTAILQQAVPRSDCPPVMPGYWEDPLVQRMP